MASLLTDRVLHVRGTQTPEGTMWAHRRDHFFNYYGCRVSRSMVEMAGHASLGAWAHHCDKGIFDTPEPRPRRIPTWSESEREEIQVESRDLPSFTSSGSTTAVNTPASELGAPDWSKQRISEVQVYSFKDLKLEEYIPQSELPDILVVEDPNACVALRGDRPSYDVRYRLVESRKPNATPTTAFLRLTSNRLPSSKDCRIYQASIRLPSTSQELSLNAKVASGSNLTVSRSKLENEADMYKGFPRYMSEDFSGYHYIKETEYDGDGILPVCAIVPKFYGYYVPESRVDAMLLSPILLSEDCGRPVDVPRLQPIDRELIFSFWHRLHRLDLVHGSVSAGNVMMQPGPLSRHPLQRSWANPSFRLVNFGDMVYRKEVPVEEWRLACFRELEAVKTLIYGKYYLKKAAVALPGYEVLAREFWSGHEDIYRYVEH